MGKLGWIERKRAARSHASRMRTVLLDHSDALTWVGFPTDGHISVQRESSRRAE
jgi:hypothetical protein